MSWLSKAVKRTTAKVSKMTGRDFINKLKPSKQVIAAAKFIPGVGTAVAGALQVTRSAAEMSQGRSADIGGLLGSFLPGAAGALGKIGGALGGAGSAIQTASRYLPKIQEYAGYFNQAQGYVGQAQDFLEQYQAPQYEPPAPVYYEPPAQTYYEAPSREEIRQEIINGQTGIGNNGFCCPNCGFQGW